jgi:hypothetical protein
MTASTPTSESPRSDAVSPGRRAKALVEMREPVIANNRAGGRRKLTAL